MGKLFAREDKTDVKTYPKDYFDVNVKLLKIASIWFPEYALNARCILIYVYNMIVIVFCMVYLTPAEFISLGETWGNLNDFSMNLGIALTHLMACLKVINWFVRSKQILVLMDTLQSNEFEYESRGDFQPGLICQRAKQKNVLVSTSYFYLGSMVFVTAYCASIYNFIFRHETYYTTDSNGNVRYCRTLPFFSWIPFDRSTKSTCLGAIAFQYFPISYITFMILAVDALFMALINYITAHLHILQEAFNTIRERSLDSLGMEQTEMLYDDGKLDAEMLNQMKKCIKHLQLVFRLCETMEDIYGFQTLGQVMVTLFVLCSCLYVLSTEPVGSKVFVVEVIYTLAIQYELTLYCWFGNELTLAGLKIPSALYESAWQSASKGYKKIMIITMSRMQKPLELTVGKFTPLTLNTLVTIVRGSYSLFAVLKKRNAVINENHVK